MLAPSNKHQFIGASGAGLGMQTTGSAVTLSIGNNTGYDVDPIVIIVQVTGGAYQGAQQWFEVLLAPPPAEQVLLYNGTACNALTNQGFRLPAPPFASGAVVEIRARLFRQGQRTSGQQIYWSAPTPIQVLDALGQTLTPGQPAFADFVNLNIPASMMGALSSEVTISAEVWNGFSLRPRATFRLQLPSQSGVWISPALPMWNFNGTGCP